MDIYALSPDELEVEFSVRNITSDVSQRFSVLKEQLDDEHAKNISVPNRPHVAACKSPRREVNFCAIKLRDFRDVIKRSIEDPLEIIELKKIYSRVVHVENRLERLRFSKCVRDEVKSLLEGAGKLIEMIEFSTAPNGDPNQTLTTEQVDGVTIKQYSDEFVNGDNVAIADGDASSSSSSNLSSPNSVQTNASGVSTCVAPNHSLPQPVEHTVFRNFPSTNTIPPSTCSCTTSYGASISHPFSSSSPGNMHFPHNSPINPINQASFRVDTSRPPPSNVTLNPNNESFHYSLSKFPQITSAIAPCLDANITQPPYQYPSVPNPPQTHTQHPYSSSAFTIRPEPLIDLSSGNGLMSIPSNISQPHRTSFARRNFNFNVQFDGSRNGLPVDRFLFRVERLATSFGIPRIHLVDELHFLLRGQAAEFYWSVLEQNQGIVDWDTMSLALRKRFIDRRADIDIRRSIDCRRQKTKEPFIEFYADILDMAIPLRTQLSPNDLLMTLLRNMSLELQHKLAGEHFSNVELLVDKCVAIEDAWNRLQKFNHPGGNYRRIEEITETFREIPTSFNQFESIPTPVSNLQPSENYLSQCPEYVSQNLHREEGVLNSVQCQRKPNTPGFQNPDYVICWNCSDIGHRFTDCPKPPQHVFCYGCGAKNVVKPNCRHCATKSGNAPMEPRPAGSYRPPKTILSQTETASNTDPELVRRFRQHQ